jgi:hypothetical protein
MLEKILLEMFPTGVTSQMPRLTHSPNISSDAEKLTLTSHHNNGEFMSS